MPTSNQVALLTRHTHQPTHALDCVVIPRAFGIRPGLAKAGDGAINDARVDGFQRRIVQPITRHVADLEVLDNHIAMHNKLTNQRLAFGFGNVTGQRTLVAIGAQVVGNLLRLRALRVFQEGRASGPRVVAGAGAFDLDHVGAEVGERLGAPGAREHAGEVEDADAV